MPNLEYFGYLYMLHHPHKHPPNFDIFNIKTNNRIKDVEITSSQYCLEYSQIDFSLLCGFIQKLRNLTSLRIDLNMFKTLSNLLIENEIKFENLYLHWDYRFVMTYKDYKSFGVKECPRYYLQEPFRRKVFKNLYLQVSTEKIDPFFFDYYHMPGIKEILYPSHRFVEVI